MIKTIKIRIIYIVIFFTSYCTYGQKNVHSSLTYRCNYLLVAVYCKNGSDSFYSLCKDCNVLINASDSNHTFLPWLPIKEIDGFHLFHTNLIALSSISIIKGRDTVFIKAFRKHEPDMSKVVWITVDSFTNTHCPNIHYFTFISDETVFSSLDCNTSTNVYFRYVTGIPTKVFKRLKYKYKKGFKNYTHTSERNLNPYYGSQYQF